MTENKRTVLAVKTMSKAGWDALAKRPDIDAVAFAQDIKPAEFLALLKSRPRVDGMILGLTRIAAAEIAAAKELAVIARIGVGYDAIDVPALTAAKVPLMLTGTANSPSVAEQAMFFILALAKKGAAMDRLVRESRWDDRLTNQPVDLMGKTVLVIGCGRIGSRTIKRCLAFEMHVVGYDPYVGPAVLRALGATPASDLDAALAAADFVTIHCPKTPQTQNLIDARRLALMKKTAYLVNTARGGIIDEAALHHALAKGVIAGAGLDVFDPEPTPPDHPLHKLSNVVLAPHMAGVSREAFDRMAEQAVVNVLSVFDGKPVRANIVNAAAIAPA